MLSGKRVFISGGTGFIGQAIVEKCIEYGAEVGFSYYRNADVAEKLVEKFPTATSISINLCDVADIKGQMDAFVKTNGAIDILINNAGVSQVMPFSLMDEEDFDLLMDVNVKGTVFMTKAVLRHMIRQKSGSIVSLGSIAGHRMYDVPIHYATSKAAISGFTFSLANEVKRYHIRVNSVVPGLIEGGVAEGIPDEQREDFVKHCATGRPGTSEEVAETVCFIASDRAKYINGQNILVDGGI